MKKKKSVSRRGFLEGAIDFSRRHATNVIVEKAGRIASPTFIRPPGALPEPEFLLICNRCGDCAPACEYKAIRLLDTTTGKAAGTPVIILRNQPCMTCDGYPCITACDQNALLLDGTKHPKIGAAHIDNGRCLSANGNDCDYCKKECDRHVKAIKLEWGGPPKVDINLCDGCGRCEYICPVPGDPAIIIKP